MRLTKVIGILVKSRHRSQIILHSLSVILITSPGIAPMPLISCPSCDQEISVVVSQAGSGVACPGCQKWIPIPNLGDLKRLAAAEQMRSGSDTEPLRSAPSLDANTGRRIVFAGLMAIAGIAAIVGLFCFVRYLAIQVPATTETHIAEVERMYHQVSAAQLVREWQQMEKFGLEAVAPYQYKQLAVEKANWRRNSLICLAVFLLCSVIGTIIARSDSRSRRNQVATKAAVSSRKQP